VGGSGRIYCPDVFTSYRSVHVLQNKLNYFLKQMMASQIKDVLCIYKSVNNLFTNLGIKMVFKCIFGLLKVIFLPTIVSPFINYPDKVSQVKDQCITKNGGIITEPKEIPNRSHEYGKADINSIGFNEQTILNQEKKQSFQF